MKKNIQSQMDELKERMETLEERMEEINPQSNDDGDQNEEIAYKFTQEEFTNFLETYTILIKDNIISQISDMEMSGEEDLYEIKIEGKEIEVSISASEVSKLIDDNVLSIDDDNVLSMAHETLDDLNIEYTFH
jgi:hypothetical protein